MALPTAPTGDVALIDFGSEAAAQFAAAIVNVRVTMPYARTVDVRLSTLSWFEWQRVEFEVPVPAAPKTLPGPNGTKLPNDRDVTYLAEVAKVSDERGYRRLAAALVKAGNRIPGDTEEAWADFLRHHMDAGIAFSLIQFLLSAALGGAARAETRAAAFHGDTEPPAPAV